MKRVHLALVVVQLSYGTLPIASKLVFDELSPHGLAWFRMLGATMLFAALAKARGIPKIRFRDFLAMAGVGLLGMFANQVLFLMGLARTSAVNASVLITTIPVFTLLFAALLGRERLDRRRGLGMLIAFGGVASLLEGFSLGSATVVGDLLVITNASAFAAYLVLSKPLVQRYGSTVVVGVAFGTATLVAAPLGAPDFLGVLPTLSTRAMGLLVFILLVPTLTTYLLNAWALRRAPSSTVAVYIYLQPVIASSLAIAILGETIDARAIGSAALIFAGVFLVVRGPSTSNTVSVPGCPEGVDCGCEGEAQGAEVAGDDSNAASSPASAALSTSS